MRLPKSVFALPLVAFALAAGLSNPAVSAPPAETSVQAPVLPPRQASKWQRFSGIARVIDGDTIAVGELRVRLEGIDAPESGQHCKRAWVGTWACGFAATQALMAMIEGREVVCEHRGLDKYGRTLGICFDGTRDINAEMVRTGLAWAFVKYSTLYVAAEAEARAAKIGIWQADTEPAWDYRNKRWASVEPQSPNGCAIKGNITRNGRIYHMPWSPWYDKINMDQTAGKRWFCNEADAAAAGWRPAYAP